MGEERQTVNGIERAYSLRRSFSLKQRASYNGKVKTMGKKFSDLVKQMSPESQKRIKEKADKLRKEYMLLRELREKLNLTQEQMAFLLDITQSTVSKTENFTDMHISTLQKFVNAMGGDLRIYADFGENEYELRLPRSKKAKAGEAKSRRKTV